jgi:hypothetical protein
VGCKALVTDRSGYRGNITDYPGIIIDFQSLYKISEVIFLSPEESLRVFDNQKINMMLYPTSSEWTPIIGGTELPINTT